MIKNILGNIYRGHKPLGRCSLVSKQHWKPCTSQRFLSTFEDVDLKCSQLFEAAKNGKVEDIPELDADHVDIRDDRGWTLLMHGCKNGHLPIVQHVLKCGSKAVLKNPSGQTSKELASFWKHQHVVDYLDENRPNCVHSKSKDYGVSVFFTQNPLARRSEMRGNDDWLYTVIQKLDTKFIMMHKSQPVVIADESRSSSRKTFMKLLQCSILETHDMLKNEGQNLIFLGMFQKDNTDSQENEVPMFCIDISHLDLKKVKEINGTAECMSVYPSVLQMSAQEASIVAQARSLTDWHFRYKYCPSCGSDTFQTESGYKRICKDPSCLSHTGLYNTNYPRVDPTMISTVLTPDKEYCLLGRKKSFPPGMYTCLAGFVEPGESIESACIREVHEEAGVTVSHVVYVASQPWPMPSVLMLGLHAIAESKGDIKIDQNELETADWFSRHQVAEMISQGNRKLFVPPPQAIAHQLLKHWLLR